MSLFLYRSLANTGPRSHLHFLGTIYIYFLTDSGNFTYKFTLPLSYLHPSTPFVCSCPIKASFCPPSELPFICLPSQVDPGTDIMGSLVQDLPHLWLFPFAFGPKPFPPIQPQHDEGHGQQHCPLAVGWGQCPLSIGHSVPTASHLRCSLHLR